MPALRHLSKSLELLCIHIPANLCTGWPQCLHTSGWSGSALNAVNACASTSISSAKCTSMAASARCSSVGYCPSICATSISAHLRTNTARASTSFSLSSTSVVGGFILLLSWQSSLMSVPQQKIIQNQCQRVLGGGSLIAASNSSNVVGRKNSFTKWHVHQSSRYSANATTPAPIIPTPANTNKSSC